jgi:hypothetical protein
MAKLIDFPLGIHEGETRLASISKWNASQKRRDASKRYRESHPETEHVVRALKLVVSKRQNDRTIKTARNQKKKWLSKEDAVLIEEIAKPTMGNVALAALMGRSRKSVEHRKRRLKLLENLK